LQNVDLSGNSGYAEPVEKALANRKRSVDFGEKADRSRRPGDGLSAV